MTTAVHDARGTTTPRRRLALVTITAAFASMLFAANLATPLYAGYAKQFGFSTPVLALIFAVYALVLIPSLMLFGQVSDQLGRRLVIALGLGLAIAALALFAAAQGVAWLFAARAVQGVAQGMMSGAATAALAELAGTDDSRHAALLATLAQAGGAASGVVLSGVLAQWAPAPLVLPFVAGMVTCVVGAALLASVPEPGSARHGGFRVRRPRVPSEIRADFARIAVTAAAVWAVAGGLFLSIMPSYAGMLVLHSHNLALLGVLTAIALGCSCLTQLATRRGAPPAQAQAGGLLALACGLVLLVLAAPGHSVIMLIAGTVLAGAGHGVAFLAAQDDLTRIATDEQRAEVSAAFYVCIYLGVALPVIGIGVLAELSTLFAAVTTFAVVTGAAALAVAAWHLARPKRRA